MTFSPLKNLPINFKELGLSQQEYEESLILQDEQDQIAIKNLTTAEMLRFQNNCHSNHSNQEDDLYASELLLVQSLENEGLSPEEIANIINNFHNKEINSIHPDECKIGTTDSSEAKIAGFINDQIEEEVSFDYIDRMIAEEILEKEKEEFEEEKESEDYINQLLKQEEEEKCQMAEEKDCKADCPICLDNLYSQEVFPLMNCRHLFHIDCLETYVIEEIKKRAFPIRCPNPECKAVIPEDDIKDTLQTHIEYQDFYDEYSIKLYLDSNPDDFYHCPTADCKFICSVDGPRFDCPECNKSYCVECKVDWHNKLKCEEYQKLKKDQGDDAFEKFANQMKYKRCPRCKIFVERIAGCNSMLCTRCKAPFCYKCGKEGDGHPH